MKNPKKNILRYSSYFSNSTLPLSFVIPSTIVLAMIMTKEIDLNIFEAAI